MSLCRCCSLQMALPPQFSRSLWFLSQKISWKCWASFHPLMIILAVLTAKIPQRVETAEKIIKLANQCLLFLPTAKYSRDLCAHKIKWISTLKRAMTRGNVLACAKPKNRYIQQHEKRSRAAAADIKYQGSKIIGMFYMLMHSYIF